MATSHRLTENAKYKLILQLSQDQIRALQQNDFASFQRILTAKGAVIAGLQNGHAAIAADPSIAVLVAQIQESEKDAEQLLQRRLSAIKARLAHIQQTKFARRAYRREEHKLPKFVPTADTPLMFDLRS